VEILYVLVDVAVVLEKVFRRLSDLFRIGLDALGFGLKVEAEELVDGGTETNEYAMIESGMNNRLLSVQ
jgi:hypothetical protein